MDWIKVYYILLVILLLWRAKFCGFKGWNEEFLSLSQTKAIQGFLAICILFHHAAQKTCAPWLSLMFIRPGLEVFVPIGYLFVGVFLFCSGYGLYKSFKTKPNYLKGFVKRRILPVVLAFYTTGIIFLIVRILMKQEIKGAQFWIYLSGLQMPNPNAWFVVALPIFYLGFYLAFRFIRNENAALVVSCLVVLAYIITGTYQDHHDWWLGGEWWYNSAHMFMVGLLFARFEKPVIGHVKKFYWIYLPVMLIGAFGLFELSEAAQEKFSYYGETWGAEDTVFRRWMCLLSQAAAGCAFTFSIFLLGMKIKIGNWALKFLGSMTLEFYLIHALYIELFCYSFTGEGPDFYYIKDVALYVLVVFVCSVISAWILKKLHDFILGTGKINELKQKKKEK